MLKLVELEILRFELDVSLDLTLEFENLTVRYFAELATVIRPPHFRSPAYDRCTVDLSRYFLEFLFPMLS